MFHVLVVHKFVLSILLIFSMPQLQGGGKLGFPPPPPLPKVQVSPPKVQVPPLPKVQVLPPQGPGPPPKPKIHRAIKSGTVPDDPGQLATMQWSFLNQIHYFLGCYAHSQTSFTPATATVYLYKPHSKPRTRRHRFSLVW